ncbi:MAG: DUF2207 domain-containing protein [Fluviicola sp.]|nr:DUF2207 domain-containing protein [Fluviicola sp.]
MKIFISFFFLFCLFFTSFSQNSIENSEKVLNFHSNIEILANNHVRVSETIKVVVKGIVFKRGIFREIPLSYDYKGGNVHVGFDLLSVKKEGEEENYFTKKKDNGIIIYVGNEDVFLKEGVYTYEIVYEVSDVLLYNEEFDEFYWNVNGNGWEVQMDKLSATIIYPKGAELIQYDGYTGQFGENNKDFETKTNDNSITYTFTKKVGYKEGLSVAVAWEKGFVTYPTLLDKLWLWVKTYILYVVGALGLFLNLIYLYKKWKKHGVDPKPGVIIPIYHAPEGFSPAECAYLGNYGEKTDTMFGSTLIGLVMKGFAKMNMEKEGLIFKHNKYTFDKVLEKTDTSSLNDIEKAFYDAFFGKSDQVIIEKGKYNANVLTTSKSLIAKVDKKQDNIYFLRNKQLIGKPFLYTLAIALVGGSLFFFYGGAILIVIIAAAISLIFNGFFIKLIEQPTRLGRQKMDEIEGFKMYMKYADKQRIEMMNPPTMNFTHFEENLSYAIALEVAEEWAGKFDPKEIEQGMTPIMPYYIGSSFANFTSMGDDLSSVISSASTPPSKSGGGSGDFSGGGGFSGGGFGGGGGGGW